MLVCDGALAVVHVSCMHPADCTRPGGLLPATLHAADARGSAWPADVVIASLGIHAAPQERHAVVNATAAHLRAAAAVARGRHVADGIKAFVVPGSEQVAKAAEAEGLDQVFQAAGFEWREPGCSMCLAMNPDRLEGRQISASSSNRNFKGRQGSASGRTLLMSPAMVAAAAVHGRVTDVRSLSLQPAS